MRTGSGWPLVGTVTCARVTVVAPTRWPSSRSAYRFHAIRANWATEAPAGALERQLLTSLAWAVGCALPREERCLACSGLVGLVVPAARWLALRWTGWIARSLGLSMLIYGAIMAKCVASEVGLRQPR